MIVNNKGQGMWDGCTEGEVVNNVRLAFTCSVF